MRGLKIYALAAFLTISEGLELRKSTETPQVVQFPIERKLNVLNPVSRDRLRRRDVVKGNLDNKDTLYLLDVSLGTPPQNIKLHLDTGSSDLWVNTQKSTLCSSRSRPCTGAGMYSANASTTYDFLASNFNISYVDGSGAEGDYVTDVLNLGGKSIGKFQFGVGYKSSSPQGILGVGYAINEVQIGRAGKRPYLNLPLRMVSDGLIKSSAYSLWLNDLDASTGNILFGGVDTAQYIGQLQTLPIQRVGGVYSEFLITMTGLSIGEKVIATNIAQAVLLDSGSSLSYLPDDLTVALYNLMGAKYDENEGAAYVPCAYAQSSITVDFSFSGPVIKVDMSELVIPVTKVESEGPLVFGDGTPACLFGISPAGSGSCVLGDTFIRSAYIVYDLENNEISIAQTNFNATENRIVEIGAGRKAVPDATPVPNSAPATSGTELNFSNDSSSIRFMSLMSSKRLFVTLSLFYSIFYVAV
ncbi:putative aspartic-type endopeptidase opsB [Erysiphe neolycopersici]|uniref:Probable aspartic-type endopeptidase OPSB n=1 Tax=Erysiphe neolycopersici TaxID=212602 RepID=A0A420HAK7_9PEZI|nr:putative aspartic-type endopeptidase opsB [Erysiphe neolycopersici]